MAPLLQALLPALIRLLPSIIEAVGILKDKDTRKDNASKLSTVAGTAGIGASAVLYIDPETEPAQVIAVLVVSILLYFYRRRAR